MSFIQTERFFDLYIGESFCDVSKLNGRKGLTPAPLEWSEDLKDIRARCAKVRESVGQDEFSLVYDDRTFRVTTMVDVRGETIYVLAIADEQKRRFADLGYPRPLCDALLAPDLTGLVLFGGPFGAGKTTSAAALAIARMEQLGELIYAAEDPEETNLNGSHGPGRCLQVPIRRDGLDLEEQLARGVRSRADAIYIGEIRRPSEAYQAVQSGVNGELIIATAHGASLSDLIERTAALASAKQSSANGLLAAGLAIVIFQQLEVVPLQEKGETAAFLRSDFLFVNKSESDSVRAKIRAGRFGDLEQEIELQRNRVLWSNDTPRA